jgi:hypothetical protein
MFLDVWNYTVLFLFYMYEGWALFSIKLLLYIEKYLYYRKNDGFASIFGMMRREEFEILFRVLTAHNRLDYEGQKGKSVLSRYVSDIKDLYRRKDMNLGRFNIDCMQVWCVARTSGITHSAIRWRCALPFFHQIYKNDEGYNC